MVITTYQGRTNITVRRPETKATEADYPSGVEFFGIIFKPGTYMPHLPIKKLRDRQDMTLPEATHQSFWLLGAAWQIPTYENADTFVNRLIREDLLAADPVVEAVLRNQAPPMSLRTLQRRFPHVTGLDSQDFPADRARPAGAGPLAAGDADPRYDLHARLFDQSHLTNTLKRFMGQTPTQILQPHPVE